MLFILRRMIPTFVIVAAAIPSHAHHSFGLYSDDVRELEGTLVDVDWRNPHVRLTLRVSNYSGGEASWTLEGAAGYILQRRGLERGLFQPGDTLRVAGRQHTRDSTLIWLHNVLLEGGEELLMIGGVEPRWTGESLGSDQELVLEDTELEDRGLFRVWSVPVLRPITYGEDLPYRETPPSGGLEWIERLNGYAERCEPVGMPGVMATPYPFQFIDQGVSIELLGFSNNAPIARTIHVPEDGRLPPEIEADRMGVSMGRWRSDRELVVTTTQIDWPYFDDSAGTPQSEDMVVTEFLTLSGDQTRLDYRMVVDESSLFTEPATVIETYWVALGEALVQPPDCSN
ncbi:MAG: DUF6152 family protein [Gammaproteobacteria bacterium]